MVGGSGCRQQGRGEVKEVGTGGVQGLQTEQAVGVEKGREVGGKRKDRN